MLIAKVDKIIELRKAHGLNQKRLSEKAGLPVNAVFRIETGAYTRTQDLRAKAIANALECKVEEIFTSEQRYADIKRAVALDPVDYEAEYDAAMARRDMCADSSFG